MLPCVVSIDLTLTVGVRYAYDEVLAEENLFRYTESDALLGFLNPDPNLALYAINAANGGFATVEGCTFGDDGCAIKTDEYGIPEPTRLAVNGGHPIAVSVYRPFSRKDEKIDR